MYAYIIFIFLTFGSVLKRFGNYIIPFVMPPGKSRFVSFYRFVQLFGYVLTLISFNYSANINQRGNGEGGVRLKFV